MRTGDITVVMDRFAPVGDHVVYHFEAHHLQHLTYCSADSPCPQSALDAGAVYYLIASVNGEQLYAFYDENGNLVGIANVEHSPSDAGEAGSGGESTETPPETPPANGDLVGSLSSEFDVGGGAASYRIPIEVPPGFGGLAPDLALTYNSNAGNGGLGVGWQISGLDAITRCERNIALDGETRAVQMIAADRFCLKGQRLVAIDGNYGDDGTTYRTRVASFVKAESRGVLGAGPETFKVTTKAGETLYFGETSDSRVTDSTGTVLTWSIRRVVDAAGNVMLVNYENTDQGHRPLSVRYSEVTPGTHDFVHQIEFDWDLRSDITSGFVAGIARQLSQRLEAIRTQSNGQPVRSYNFSYIESQSTGRSLLSSIQACGPTGVQCLPATMIGWRHPDRTVNNMLAGRDRIDDDWGSRSKKLIPFDYDGDGDTDYLSIPGSVYKLVPCCRDGSTVLALNTIKLLRNHNGTISVADVSDWFDTSAVGGKFSNAPKPLIRAVDYDGDGRQELAIFGIPHMSAEYVCGRGGITCQDLSYRAKVVNWANGGFGKSTISTNASPSGQLIVLDTNGDGRQALLSLAGSYCKPDGACGRGGSGTTVTPPSRLYRYTGSGWSSHSLGTAGAYLKDAYGGYSSSLLHLKPIDIDGDGASELLSLRTSISSHLLIPNAAGTAFGVQNVSNKWGMSAGAWYPKNRVAVPMDINGDGNQDLLLQRKASDSSSTFLLVSNGKSFEYRLDVTSLWGMNGTTWNASKRVAVPHDFNRDGLDDILLQGIDGNSSFLLMSKGDHLEKTSVSNRWGMSQSDWSAEKRSAYIVNHDRDRVPELLLHASGNRSSWLLRDVHSDPADSVADKVTGINEGGLQQYSVQYQVAGHGEVYTPGPDSGWAYPERSVQGGFVVASRSTMRDGIGGLRSAKYEYHDLRLHQGGHGALGFSRTVHIDETTNQETVTELNNTDSRLAGMVERMQTRIDGQLIREVDNEYQFAGNQPNGVHFPYLARSTKNKYELDGTHLATVTTENIGYDAWGNVGRVEVTTTDHVHGKTWQQTTDNTWESSSPETGRLLASEVTHTHPDGSTIVRGSAFAYDPATGILVEETVQPGGGVGLEQTTRYALDRWGNRAATIVSAAAPNAPSLPVHLQDWPDRTSSRATEINTAAGLRTVAITNADGHTESRHYRLSDGALERQTGPNGLTTEFEYDALGRRIRTISPDGTEATTTRQWATHPDIPRSIYRVTEAATGQPSETTWYDRLGREVGSTRPGLDGRIVREIREHNPRGEVSRSSRPHFAGDTPHWIEFSYDARGRVVERSFPLGASTGGGRGTIRTAYDGYVTTVTDAEGRSTSKERNAREQLIRATDAEGGTVTYGYDAQGELIETTDPLGRTTTFIYDARGRKTRMTTPDMGTWSYVYNGFGELIAQADAKGQSVYIDYDVLGRKTRRDEPEGTTEWCYDADGSAACGTVAGGYGAAVGKLVEVTGPSLDYRKTIQYDDLGRPVRQTTHHLGEETEAYPIETSYDRAGRVDSTVYPQGFTLYNDYNQHGYLVRKISPLDHVAADYDGHVVEAERLARMVARYQAKATDYRAHADLYERMANDYAASGDNVMAARLDVSAAELRDLTAALDQAAADKQAELDQLDADTNADAETLRVRFGPDADDQIAQDTVSAAARGSATAWLDAAEEHLDRAQRAEIDGLHELRDQELALAQNALAAAQAAAAEADVPESGTSPSLAEMVPQGAGAGECDSTALYEVYWCAESADAEGRIDTLHYGNGLVTRRGYEAASGHLAGIRTTAAGDAGIVRQDLEYRYDRVNNVTRRADRVTGIAQDYAYDTSDRLVQADVTLDPFGDGPQTSTYQWSYDALGNRKTDTRLGTYEYTDAANPGRLTAAGGDALSYDANGNVTAYSGRVLTWSSFNKPIRIEADGHTVEFAYGADRARFRRHEVRTDGSQQTTRYVGAAYERILTVQPGGESTTVDRYFIHAAGRLVAVHEEDRTSGQADNRFLHRDALGSVTLITDALGQVVERYAFRPFGERAVIETAEQPFGGLALTGISPQLTRGFTGHEHLEAVGLIHMNGRVYDPRLGRFLSADPNVQFPADARGYNRYAYVQNNPLKYTDPSGYFISALVSLAVTALLTTEFSVVAAAFIATTAISLGTGADFKTALKYGAIAAGTAWAFHKVGNYANKAANPETGGGDAAWASGGWKKVVAHATVGGLASEVAGGKFGYGAIGAGFSQFVSPRVGVQNIRSSFAGAKQVAVAAVIGGTGSALSGGRFVNGAATAAFGWMFNELGGNGGSNNDERPFTAFPETSETKWQRAYGPAGKAIVRTDIYESGWHNLPGAGEIIDQVLRRRLYIDIQIELTIYGEYELWREFAITTKHQVDLLGNFRYNSEILKIDPPVPTGRTRWIRNGIETDTDITGVRACPISCATELH